MTGSSTPSTLPPLPEPYRVDLDGDGQDDGWRVETTCKSCQAGIYLDSPDVDAEDGSPTGEPNERALKIARSMMVCDHCDSELEREEEGRSHAIELRKRLESSGLPRELRALSWDDMDREGGRRDAIVSARAWAEHGGLLFLTGDVGVGKTRLAATALWERLEHGDAIWMPVASLMQWAFFPSLSAERQRAQRALAAPVPLVLDDLGKEKPGDWVRQIIFGAVDLRLQAGVPVIVTSNHSANELAARLGKGFGSRLQEFKQFQLVGRDRRTNP